MRVGFCVGGVFSRRASTVDFGLVVFYHGRGREERGNLGYRLAVVCARLTARFPLCFRLPYGDGDGLARGPINERAIILEAFLLPHHRQNAVLHDAFGFISLVRRNLSGLIFLQKVTTLDSEMRLANLIGSMNVAFKVLRSSSVTPRATEQAPQTYTVTFPFTFSISSGNGGKPTP